MSDVQKPQDAGQSPEDDPARKLPDEGAENDESGDEDTVDPANAATPTTNEPAKKKKKSKRKKLKAAITGSSEQPEDGAPESSQGSSSKGERKLSPELIETLIENNPALGKELAGKSKKDIESLMQKLSMSDLLTGMAVAGKNQKDMASYKFWQTQPVPKLGEKPQERKEGPIKTIDPEKVPKQPSALIDGFEWVTMDLENQAELEEVYELLTFHYVEDDEAMFRFKYSVSFLNWALKSPGWRKEWHVGVRATKSRKLVAFISGVPMDLRIRSNTVRCSEVNFLCIHKKLRSKRLAPVLIQEITRRCYEVGIYQAIYTAGIVLPTPVSTCRYFHRSINWEKLYRVGFSRLPTGASVARTKQKFDLSKEQASTDGLRPMAHKDKDAVLNLLRRYLERFDMAPVFTPEELEHWMLHDTPADLDAPKDESREQVVWAYVVEDPTSHKITDFFSFYILESSVIHKQSLKDPDDETVRAAYLYYYATEAAFEGDKSSRLALKNRLNDLMHDALVLAQQANFDVFNALTLQDNALFLEKQKFGAGDGQLNYYLYNYATAPIAGGVDARNNVDDKNCSGIGVVML